MKKPFFYRLMNNHLLQSILLSPVLSPMFGPIIPSIHEIIFWGFYHLGRVIDTAFLFAVRVAIIFGKVVNALIAFIHGTLLQDALKVMFKAVGLPIDGEVGGIFVVFFIIAILLAGLSYIMAIFFPNARMANLRNVFFNSAFAVLLAQTSFSLLTDLEKFRFLAYETVNSEVYTFIDEQGWLGNQATRANNSLGIDVTPLISPLVDEPRPDIDAVGDYGKASMSGADLLAAFIGISSSDQIAEKYGDSGDAKLKVFPDLFESAYFPSVDGGSLNDVAVKEYITGQILPGMVHAGIAFLMIIPVTLEAVTILVLALTGFLLFMSLPLALIFSFFTKTEGYLSNVTSKYLQLIFLTITMGIIIPLLVGICMGVAGYIGYLIGGSILWLAGLLYVWRPAMDALDTVVSGAAQAAGFGSMSGTIASAAGKMGGLASGAIGTAAMLPGGLARLGIGAAKTAGKGAVAAAKLGMVGYGLGRAAGGFADKLDAGKIADPAQRELAMAEAEKKQRQGLNTAAVMGGNLFGKTKAANWITAAASLIKSEKKMSFGDTMAYADTGDAMVAGISTSAEGGLFGVMYAADRLKGKAMANMAEAKAAMGEKPGGDGQKAMSPVKNALRDVNNSFKVANAAGLLTGQATPAGDQPGTGETPAPGGQPPAPDGKAPSMPPGIGPDGKPLPADAKEGTLMPGEKPDTTVAAAQTTDGKKGDAKPGQQVAVIGDAKAGEQAPANLPTGAKVEAQAQPAAGDAKAAIQQPVQAEVKAGDAPTTNLPAGAKVEVQAQPVAGDVKTAAPQPVQAEVKAGDAPAANLPAGAKVEVQQAQPVAGEVKTAAPQPVQAEVKAGDAPAANLPAGAKVEVQQAQPVQVDVKAGDVTAATIPAGAKIEGQAQPVQAEVKTGEAPAANLPAGAKVEVQAQPVVGEVKATAKQPVQAEIKAGEGQTQPVQVEVRPGEAQTTSIPTSTKAEVQAEVKPGEAPTVAVPASAKMESQAQPVAGEVKVAAQQPVQVEVRSGETLAGAMPTRTKVDVQAQPVASEVKATAQQPVQAEVQPGEIRGGARAEVQAQTVSTGEVKTTAPQPVQAEVRSGEVPPAHLPSGVKVEAQARPGQVDAKPVEYQERPDQDNAPAITSTSSQRIHADVRQAPEWEETYIQDSAPSRSSSPASTHQPAVDSPRDPVRLPEGRPERPVESTGDFAPARKRRERRSALAEQQTGQPSAAPEADRPESPSKGQVERPRQDKRKPRQTERREIPEEEPQGMTDPVYDDDAWPNRVRVDRSERQEYDEWDEATSAAESMGIPGAEDALESLSRYKAEQDAEGDDLDYGRVAADIPGVRETLDELARMTGERETEGDDLVDLPAAPDASELLDNDEAPLLDWLFATGDGEGDDDDDQGWAI